jgi:hypothetical protein
MKTDSHPSTPENGQSSVHTRRSTAARRMPIPRAYPLRVDVTFLCPPQKGSGQHYEVPYCFQPRAYLDTLPATSKHGFDEECSNWRLLLLSLHGDSFPLLYSGGVNYTQKEKNSLSGSCRLSRNVPGIAIRKDLANRACETTLPTYDNDYLFLHRVKGDLKKIHCSHRFRRLIAHSSISSCSHIALAFHCHPCLFPIM